MRAARIGLIALVVLAGVSGSRAAIIRTLAGGGPNGGPALDAGLVLITAELDGAGTIHFSSLNRVYRISAGNLVLLAGTGVSGFGGDGGPATSALLNNPAGLAIDPSGNIYIAEILNHRVRRVDASTGVITTVAGTGTAGYNGDGIPAVNAQLVEPFDVDLDPQGRLVISEQRRVRRIDPASGLITTIAGNGTVGFNGDGIPAITAGVSPLGIDLDAAGNLFVTDFDRIRRIDAVTGIITTVAGSLYGFAGDGGPATSALLGFPIAVDVDAVGNLYIADTDNHRVRRVDTAGIITTISQASLFNPTDVLTIPGDAMLIVDRTRRIVMEDLNSHFVTPIAGNGTCCYSGDGGPAPDSQVGPVVALGFDSVGNLFLADAPRVRRVDAASLTIDTVHQVATGTSLKGMAVDPAGHVYLSLSCDVKRWDVATGQLTHIAGTGVCANAGDGGQAALASVQPQELALDAQGNLYVDSADRIRRIEAGTGLITTVPGSTGVSFNGLAVHAGDLYASSRSQRKVFRLSGGTLTPVAGNGIAFYGGDGGPATAAGMDPWGIAFDGEGGLLIGDFSNYRVRRVDMSSGLISTLAGIGVRGSTGDGGPPAAASLDGPSQLAVLGDRIVISQGLTPRIREIAPDAAPPALTLDPAELWPPNHRLVEVRAIIAQTPGCPAPVAVIESILSDEPDDATGDGDGRTTQDIRDAEFGTEDMVFRLRAERSGSGGGRTYTVSYAVTCGAGPPVTASGTIFVPHDREGVTEPVDLSVDPAPGGSVVSWPSLGDGYRYNVIRGHLAELVQTAEAIWLGDVTCVAAQLEASDTVGLEDAALPDPGAAFFYLVEYMDGLPSQYGTAQAIRPYTPGAGSCSTEAAGQMLFNE